MDVNRVYCGDAREVMETFPDGVVDMCVTSPPYWGLRDYGVDGCDIVTGKQIGRAHV